MERDQVDAMDAFCLASGMNEYAKWHSTAVQNLIRYRPSGTYFARLRVRRKLIVKSLKTDVFSVAKQRLPDLLREFRGRAELAAAVARGKMLVADAAELHLERIRSALSLKPSSKRYREMLVGFIRRSSPTLFSMDVRKVTERDCRIWLARYHQRYAPSVVNNSIGTLRAIFDETNHAGIRHSNPTAGLQRMKIRTRARQLPSREEFARLVDAIRTAGARQSKDCANLIQFLAYSGTRIGEAKHVIWADVDFARRVLHVRGDPETATKNGNTRYVPMIPELEQLLIELRTQRPMAAPKTAVMRVFHCGLSIAHAAEKIGISRITHHDLRHLFATVCIESGVDIPTVSRWLGHKDGGALCLRTYGHLRDEHSLAQARRVSFSIMAKTSNTSPGGSPTTEPSSRIEES
jgi:integrase